MLADERLGELPLSAAAHECEMHARIVAQQAYRFKHGGYVLGVAEISCEHHIEFAFGKPDGALGLAAGGVEPVGERADARGVCLFFADDGRAEPFASYQYGVGVVVDPPRQALERLEHQRRGDASGGSQALGPEVEDPEMERDSL